MRIVSWTLYGILQINTEVHVFDGDEINSARLVTDEDNGKIIGLKFRENSSILFFDKDWETKFDDEITHIMPLFDDDGKLIGIKSKYSEIIIYGQTRPRLKIPAPPKVKRGWKHLTAIYGDDFKEYYLGTLRRTLVYYGRKVWINCPTIYYQEEYHDKRLILTADLFTNNRRVPGGKGVFKYHYRRVSDLQLEVVKGYAKESHLPIVLRSKLGFKVVPENGIDYEFYYYGSEKHELSESEGKGYIYTFKVPSGKIPLVVEVPTIITNRNDNCHTKLIARVHHREYTGYVKRSDVPSGGYVTFYVDGKMISYNNQTHWKISTSGYASIPFKATSDWSIGTHNIVAVYTPDTPELQRKYIETSGSGTLFIGTDGNKPCFTSSDPWCTFMGNDGKNLTFKTNKAVNGTVQLYLDGELVHLKGSVAPDYSVPIVVAANKSFTITFDSLGKASDNGYHWMYGGYHNIMMCYTFDDGWDIPMEYWYYFDDFYIQIPTDIELLHEVDVNEYGDNVFYLDDDGITVKHHKPNIPLDREKSLTVGTPLRVFVKDLEDNNKGVNGGYVRVTWVSRTENDNIEETTELW